MIKLAALSVAASAVFAFSPGAQAHARHHHYHRHFITSASQGRYWLHANDSHRFAYRHNWDRPYRSARNDEMYRSWPSGPDREWWSNATPWTGGRGRHRHRRYAERSAYRGGYGARPSAWCGWEMRHLVSSDPGPSYNLARNWAHWGHPGPAGIGAVVVWRHHVGKIVGRRGAEWIIESGNDGHRTRVRPRPIGGAIAIRWG
jgi:hypothetical protein